MSSPSLDIQTSGREQFTMHLLTALTEASQSIWLSDFDFSDCMIDSPDSINCLNQCLRNNATARVRILLGNTSYLQINAPRFTQLRRRLGHKIDCRLAATDAGFRSGMESLIVVDERHILRRAAPPSFNARWQMDNPDLASQCMAAYDYAWSTASACLPVTHLGL